MENRGRPRWLDPKECFYLWCELGNIPRVQKNLASRGIVNPTTKKQATEGGVRFAAYLYMLYNPEEVRKEFMKRGCFLPGDEIKWIHFLKKLANVRLTTKKERYDKWYEEFRKYEESIT